MKIHTMKQKVYYADTDAYGVVWHGAYLRWLEAARVELCEAMGLNLIDLKNNDIALPVVNLNVRYKASARLNDNLIIETSITKYNGLSVTFSQLISLPKLKKLLSKPILMLWQLITPESSTGVCLQFLLMHLSGR